MSSLVKFSGSNLVGFSSYSREDDEGFNDALFEFADRNQRYLGALLGRTLNDFRIWQDTECHPSRAMWKKTLEKGIAESVFFVPIVTPRAVKSQHCATEFALFLAREAELGRDDRFFPILYLPVPELDDDALCRDDPVLKIIRERQYFDRGIFAIGISTRRRFKRRLPNSAVTLPVRCASLGKQLMSDRRGRKPRRSLRLSMQRRARERTPRRREKLSAGNTRKRRLRRAPN